jgi:hypothetical protein
MAIFPRSLPLHNLDERERTTPKKERGPAEDRNRRHGSAEKPDERTIATRVADPCSTIVAFVAAPTPANGAMHHEACGRKEQELHLRSVYPCTHGASKLEPPTHASLTWHLMIGIT